MKLQHLSQHIFFFASRPEVLLEVSDCPKSTLPLFYWLTAETLFPFFAYFDRTDTNFQKSKLFKDSQQILTTKLGEESRFLKMFKFRPLETNMHA